MGNSAPPSAAFQRTLAMLEAVIGDDGGSCVSAISRNAGIPVATAHRHVATLVSTGLLAKAGHGRHVAGSRLLSLLRRLDEAQVAATFAAPVLHRLAARLGSVVQLGTFENDMVTYRIKAGHGANALFTRIGMQLEAYCSGIGKVLLAHLPDAERARYLAGGPFVALTPRTITDPQRLAEELDKVRFQGFAIDDGEIADGLVCLAVPLCNPVGKVLAAISVSNTRPTTGCFGDPEWLRQLQIACREIERGAFGPAKGQVAAPRATGAA